MKEVAPANLLAAGDSKAVFCLPAMLACSLLQRQPISLVENTLAGGNPSIPPFDRDLVYAHGLYLALLILKKLLGEWMTVVTLMHAHPAPERWPRAQLLLRREPGSYPGETTVSRPYQAY